MTTLKPIKIKNNNYVNQSRNNQLIIKPIHPEQIIKKSV